MKLVPIVITFVCLILHVSDPSQAACPLDHIIIGCNQDGQPNTPDDNVLFLDTRDLYRRTDPLNPGDHTWLYWHYTLTQVGNSYYIGQPGFGQFHHPDELGDFPFEDPNRCLTGVKDVNYRIMVECLDLSAGFYASINFVPTLNEPGNEFNHSGVSDSEGHMHLQYWAPDTQLHWITYRIYDAFYDPGPPETGYRPSEPITVVFGRAPLAGDIHVDGYVNLLDLEKLAFFWLSFSESTAYNTNGQAKIDMFDRADINRDYVVDFIDYSLLAQDWLLLP